MTERKGPLVVRQLFDALDARQLSQRRIARLAGVPADTLSDWRHGHHSARIDLFEAVANAAGYDVVLTKRDNDAT